MSPRPRLTLLVTLAVAAVVAAAAISPVSADRPDVTQGYVRDLVRSRLRILRTDILTLLAEQRPLAVSSSVVGPMSLPGAATDSVVSSVRVSEAGSYFVTAKLWWNVIAASSTASGGEIDCDLLAEEAFDTSRESGVTDFDYGTLALQLTHHFEGPGTVFLRCRDEFGGGNPVEVHNVVLTAIRVSSLTGPAARTAPPRAEVQAPQRPR